MSDWTITRYPGKEIEAMVESQIASELLSRVFARGCWFHYEPWPSGYWLVVLKDEQRDWLAEQIREIDERAERRKDV